MVFLVPVPVRFPSMVLRFLFLLLGVPLVLLLALLVLLLLRCVVVRLLVRSHVLLRQSMRLKRALRFAIVPAVGVLVLTSRRCLPGENIVLVVAGSILGFPFCHRRVSMNGLIAIRLILFILGKLFLSFRSLMVALFKRIGVLMVRRLVVLHGGLLKIIGSRHVQLVIVRLVIMFMRMVVTLILVLLSGRVLLLMLIPVLFRG